MYNKCVRIDGAEIADEIYEDLKGRVSRLAEKNIIPHLAVILVGENPASVAYVTLKQKKGEAIGAKVTLHKYPTTISSEELLQKIEELNADFKIHGILIQRPLPDQIDVPKLELATNSQKDVDGFHPDSPFTLPLPLAVVKILEYIFWQCHPERSEGSQTDSSATPQNDNFLTWLKGQKVVVIGKGPTGGGPIIKLLNKLGAKSTVIDSKTENPKDLMRKADVIISSVGRENVVRAEDIKQGVILIGVGVLRGEDKKLKGDYDTDAIKNIAGYYTPTPGGVGPVNVAQLMVNLLTAAELQTKSS